MEHRDDALREPLRGGETILLADDEHGVRALAATLLKRKGYTVMEAENGAAALERWRAQSEAIDLIIADLSMPKMSGYELIAHVRKEDAELPILIASGFGEEHLLEKVLDPGVAFLQKPYRAQQLAETVRSLLDTARARRA